MTSPKRFVAAAAVALALGAAVGAQQPPAAVIDVQALGPQVGATVPDFTLSTRTA